MPFVQDQTSEKTRFQTFNNSVYNSGDELFLPCYFSMIITTIDVKPVLTIHMLQVTRMFLKQVGNGNISRTVRMQTALSCIKNYLEIDLRDHRQFHCR